MNHINKKRIKSYQVSNIAFFLFIDSHRGNYVGALPEIYTVLQQSTYYVTT